MFHTKVVVVVGVVLWYRSPLPRLAVVVVASLCHLLTPNLAVVVVVADSRHPKLQWDLTPKQYL
jgi:hypothetical protein